VRLTVSAALAGLAGLFSKQAADKLKEVFENLSRRISLHESNPLKPGSTGEGGKSTE
jgi:hypothetical protein